MDPSQASTFGMAVVVNVAILLVALYARSQWRADRQPCVCNHRRNRHVNFMDWDSDYGDPRHISPAYRTPGTCRDCRCRHFIPGEDNK